MSPEPPAADVPRLQLMSREGCHLCETAAADLAPIARAAGVAVTVVDITHDAALLSRFGYEIPVVVVDGEPVCVFRVDTKRVSRALKDGPAGRRRWWRSQN